MKIETFNIPESKLIDRKRSSVRLLNVKLILIDEKVALFEVTSNKDIEESIEISSSQIIFNGQNFLFLNREPWQNYGIKLRYFGIIKTLPEMPKFEYTNK